MIVWLLAAIAFLLFAWGYRESFTDPEFKVTRPSETDAAWLNKIDAAAPLDGDDKTYIRVLQAFYDTVYLPSPAKPRDVDVEVFLKSPAATVPGIDPVSLRKIITTAFHIDLSVSAAAREQQQIVTTGVLAGFSGSNLQPGNARDEVRTRTENIYVPADSRKGELPEGLYEPTMQTEPLRPGDFKDNSTSWSSVAPMSFCEDGDSECMKNVL
jgi:hypothetical protein